MIYTAETKKAMKLAYNYHHGQEDKANMPYFYHPLLVANEMDDEDSTVVALLHDVVEDTTCTMEDLKKAGFSDRVLEALALMTHDDDTPYMEYVKRLSLNPIARKVKRADLRHNSDLTRRDEITEEALSLVKRYKKAIEFLEGIE